MQSKKKKKSNLNKKDERINKNIIKAFARILFYIYLSDFMRFQLFFTFVWNFSLVCFATEKLITRDFQTLFQKAFECVNLFRLTRESTKKNWENKNRINSKRSRLSKNVEEKIQNDFMWFHRRHRTCFQNNFCAGLVVRFSEASSLAFGKYVKFWSSLAPRWESIFLCAMIYWQASKVVARCFYAVQLVASQQPSYIFVFI